MYKVIYNGDTEKVALGTVWGATLKDLLAEDEKVIYLDADLMLVWDCDAVLKEFPDRIVDVGIAEQNMVAIGSAMSLTGLKPYMHTFTAFLTRRAFDQIFLSAAYGKKDIRLIGSQPGITQEYNGGTHMCFEDIGLMQTIPNITIVDATDSVMFDFLLRDTKDRKGVFYFRAFSGNNVAVYDKGSTFEYGKGCVLKEGKDAAIIACGCMVGEALAAAELLKADGIDAKVVDIFTIKPIDKELVLECAKTGAVVTAENHSMFGGLGSSVSMVLAEANADAVMGQIAIKEEFGEVGDMPYLRKKFRLTKEDIAAEVKAAMAKK